MLKQILVISDPEQEVEFGVVADYCEVLQKRLGKEVAVIPIWPHGKAELIGDKRKMKATIKTYKETLAELETELEE